MPRPRHKMPFLGQTLCRGPTIKRHEVWSNLFGKNCVGEEFILREVKVECKAHGILFTETQMTDNFGRRTCLILLTTAT